MMRSLFSGVAGLKSHQTRMDVIGNNIANVNTTGFKSSRVTFQDTMNQTLVGTSAATASRGGTNAQQIGLGVGVGSIDTIMTNGSTETTNKNTDMAISGAGFFVVNDGNSAYYTRNGAFSFDEKGTYGMPGSGLKVQGWTADASGVLNTTGATTDIVIPTDSSMAAKVTTTANYSKNLSADSGKTKIATMTITFANGKTLTVPSDNTTDYALQDGVSGVITGVTGKLSDGTVVEGSATASIKNGSAIAGTTVTGMAVTLADGTIMTATGASTLAAQKGAKVSGTGSTVATIGTVGLTAGTLSGAVAGTAYKVGGTLSGTVTNATTVTLSDLSTITGLSGLTPGDSYTATINSISGVALNDGNVTISKVGTGTFKIGSVISSPVDAIDGLTLADGSQVTTVGSGKFTMGAALPGTVSLLTVNVGAQSFEIPSSDMTDSFKKGDTLEASLGGTAGTPLTISAMLVNLEGGGTATALAGTSYASGSSTYTPVTTTVTVFDSLGSKHSVPVVLTKAASNTWTATLVPNQSDGKTTKIDGATVTGSLGTITFDESSGKFKTGTGYSLALTGYTNGAVDSTISLDFSGLTQYSGESTASCSDYNGYAAGALKSVSFDSSGIATATYTNNERRQVAQVAMALCNNPSGLEKAGGSLYSASNNSGKIQVSTVAGAGCSVTPSALEMSNVDLASEFSSMIVTQRGYQSNSKIITVSDEMLETLIGMKR